MNACPGPVSSASSSTESGSAPRARSFALREAVLDRDDGRALVGLEEGPEFSIELRRPRPLRLRQRVVVRDLDCARRRFPSERAVLVGNHDHLLVDFVVESRAPASPRVLERRWDLHVEPGVVQLEVHADRNRAPRAGLGPVQQIRAVGIERVFDVGCQRGNGGRLAASGTSPVAPSRTPTSESATIATAAPASTGRAARVGATNAHADQRIDSHTKATITHHHRTRYGPSSPTIRDPAMMPSALTANAIAASRAAPRLPRRYAKNPSAATPPRSSSAPKGDRERPMPTAGRDRRR